MKDSKLYEEGFTRLLNFLDIELPQHMVSDIVRLWGSERIPFPLELIKELGKGKEFTLFVQCTRCHTSVASDRDHCPWCEGAQIQRQIIILDDGSTQTESRFSIHCSTKVHRQGNNGETEP